MSTPPEAPSAENLSGLGFSGEPQNPEKKYQETLEGFLQIAQEKAGAASQSVEEHLQGGLVTWRDAYAEAIKDNSAATLGWGKKSSHKHLDSRSSKRNLEEASEKYKLHVDALGVLAAKELRESPTMVGKSEEEKDLAVCELGILGTLGKLHLNLDPTKGPVKSARFKDSEAEKLAKRVEEKRSQAAVYVDDHGKEITVHDKGLRNKVRGLTNKFIHKWQKWDQEAKEAGWRKGGWKKQVKVIGKKALALTPAAAVTVGVGAATGGAALAVAASAAGVAGFKAAATHNLGKRADALGAREENERTVGDMQNSHDASEAATGATLVEAFSGASHKNRRKNLIKAGVAAVATAGAVVGANKLHPLVDHLGHAMSHPGHVGTGTQGGRAEALVGGAGQAQHTQTAAEHATHAAAAHKAAAGSDANKPTLKPGNNTLLHPNGTKTSGLPNPPHHAAATTGSKSTTRTEGLGTKNYRLEHHLPAAAHQAQAQHQEVAGADSTNNGSHVLDVNPKGGHTIDETFHNAHVNVHDQYNAMDAALHAGALKQVWHPDGTFSLVTAHGSANSTKVTDILLNYMPKGHIVDSATGHVSGSALTAHTADTYGGVKPFAQQTAHHAATTAHNATHHAAQGQHHAAAHPGGAHHLTAARQHNLDRSLEHNPQVQAHNAAAEMAREQQAVQVAKDRVVEALVQNHPAATNVLSAESTLSQAIKDQLVKVELNHTTGAPQWFINRQHHGWVIATAHQIHQYLEQVQKGNLTLAA